MWYVNCIFHEPPQEKQQGERSRDLGGQNWSAKSSIPCNLSIVEVEIHSGNVDHSDDNGWSSVLLENVISWIFIHLRNKPVLQHFKIRYSSNRIATRSEVRGLNSAGGDGFLFFFFSEHKILSMTSFGKEVKPLVPYHRFMAYKRTSSRN